MRLPVSSLRDRPRATPRPAGPCRPATAAVALLVSLAVLAGCASPTEQAQALARAGRHDEALRLLGQAAAERPGDTGVRLQLLKARSERAQQLVLQAEAARSAGKLDEASRLLAAVAALQPDHPRLVPLRTELARADARSQRVAQAQAQLRAGRIDLAEQLVTELLTEEPGHPAGALLRQQLADARPRRSAPLVLGEAFRQPLSLEFRDAPLRAVFEAMARGTNVNFVFDREVRGDVKVTLFLRNTTLDEALRIVLSTQGLERKLLNDSTLLIYPNTPAKQREHQDLATRAFYLSNADVKQAQNLVRTLAKARDVHIDERLNLLLVRDTPEVLRLIEKLLATVDLPEAEVMLEVQVMEVASDRLDSLGLQWPEQVSFGLPGVTDGSIVPLGQLRNFRGLVATPGVVANLRGSSGTATLIANPSIRVRNREKAKVHVGDKLPVFTTTSTANVGVSSSVSYLDTGLKLEIEPQVMLGSEVAMKVQLEVTNFVKNVAGPNGALAYQVGTRLATTTLRLKDGETQVLAGLINDEDRKSASGIPGLSGLPVLGALFGVQGDTRNKTEVVLLITPHVVRNVAVPGLDGLLFDSGVDANPGALPLRLSAAAGTGLALSAGGGAGGGAAAPVAAAAATASQPPAEVPSGLVLSGSASGVVGETVSVTLRNASTLEARGELQFDAGLLQAANPADVANAAAPGRLPFTLPAGGEQVVVLRVLASARGMSTQIGVTGVTGRRADGQGVLLPVSGDVMLDISAD